MKIWIDPQKAAYSMNELLWNFNKYSFVSKIDGLIIEFKFKFSLFIYVIKSPIESFRINWKTSLSFCPLFSIFIVFFDSESNKL